MKQHIKQYYTLLVLTTTFFSTSVYAQDQKEMEAISLVNETKNEQVFEFAFGVPDSPALSLAGLKASDTTKVDELQDFIVSLPQLAESGKAVAIDLSPANILMPIGPEQDTLQFYQEDGQRAYRMLRRTRLSVLVREGKTHANDPSKSVKSLLAMGLTTSVLDRSDPLYAFSLDKVSRCKQFRADIQALNSATKVNPVNPQVTDILKELLRANSKIGGKTTLHDLQNALETVKQARIIVKTLGKPYAPPVPALDQNALAGDIRNVINHLKVKFPSKVNRINDALKQTNLADIKNNKELCFKAVNEAKFYKPNLDIGAALLWRGSEDGVGELHPGGQALWVSYRHPVKFKALENSKRYFVLGASGRAAFGEMATTGDMTVTEAESDTLQAWLGAEFYSDKWRAAGQLGYVDVDFDDPATEPFSRSGEKWQMSADYAVTDNIWLGLSYGKAQGTIEALDGEKVTVDIKFRQPKAFNLFNLN